MAVKTPNQVVGHNMRLRRKALDWTQDEAAAHLEPFLGVRWNKSAFSHAEKGTRPRQFSADELVAIAQAFGISVSKLLTPVAGVRVRLPSGRIAQRADYRRAVGADTEYELLVTRNSLLDMAMAQVSRLPKGARVVSVAGMKPEKLRRAAAAAIQQFAFEETKEDAIRAARRERSKGTR